MSSNLHGKVVKSRSMQKQMWLEYPSSISDIVEKNKSFDACSIRVMYTGKNRNRTSISKDAAEAALPTLYNCPIVCNYDVVEDKIGGHDVEFINTKHGMKMVNLTDAVGVIPYGAEYRWETVTEENGQEHEYLVVDGLLWKRSSVYDKLKRDGISGQSMEITVNSGKSVDGVYEIYSFDFTAFCILGEDVEPCFESADIETFSLGVYKTRFEHMMDELKAEYSIAAGAKDGGTEFSLKGGEGKVNLKDMLAKFGLTEEDITFETDGMTEEELEAKFSEIRDRKFADGDNQSESGENETPAGETPAAETPADESGTESTGADAPAQNDDQSGDDQSGDDSEDDETDPNTDEEDDASGGNAKRNSNFSVMAGQVAEELRRSLASQTYHDDYWDEECRRYWYIDHDAEAGRVYAQDWQDDVVCAFGYVMNGDHAVIDFASYKRQKVQFVDFDDGEPMTAMFNYANDAMMEVFNKKLEKATAGMAELQKFHDETVAAQRKAKLEEVFASFADMNGNESFEELRSNCDDLSVEEITEKCYAIRGRSVKVNFSMNTPQAVRLPVERKLPEKNDPYNGVFARYGF